MRKASAGLSGRLPAELLPRLDAFSLGTDNEVLRKQRHQAFDEPLKALTIGTATPNQVTYAHTR